MKTDNTDIFGHLWSWNLHQSYELLVQSHSLSCSDLGPSSRIKLERNSSALLQSTLVYPPNYMSWGRVSKPYVVLDGSFFWHGANTRLCLSMRYKTIFTNSRLLHECQPHPQTFVWNIQHGLDCCPLPFSVVVLCSPTVPPSTPTCIGSRLRRIIPTCKLARPETTRATAFSTSPAGSLN